MKKFSLKLKITLWYTLVLAIVSSIVLFAMSSISREMVDKELSEKLVKSVDGVSKGMVDRYGKLRPVPGFMLYQMGVHMVIFDDNGNLIHGNIPFGITDIMDFSDERIRDKKYDGNDYLVYDKKVNIKNTDNVVWVKGFVSKAEEIRALNGALKNNIMLTALLIIVAALGGYFIIDRSFVPVKKIRQTAVEIAESNDLSRRINIGKGKDEIYELAYAFDTMLKKLEKIFEKEKQFTSDASHELRTPVSVILSECEYINDCVKTEEEYKESVSSIHKQAIKMNNLISELLMISRMDKNTLRTSFEKTDISELLEFVCDEQEEIQNKEVILERKINKDIIAVSDRSLIARMFINIISNAYQFSKKNGKVSVCLESDKKHFIFSVEDDGIGIRKENIEKIFERFYQENESRSSNDAGNSGLGLSMVKWIVECHKGNIEVYSEKDKGSKFVITIPLE